MSLNLHIEHLILEGTPFAASESRAFRAALERELTAQSAGIELPGAASMRRVSVRAPAIRPGEAASIQTWAAATARSLIAAVHPQPNVKS